MRNGPETLSPTPRRWIPVVGALGGTALGLGALAFATGSLAVVTELGRGPTAVFGLAAAILTILGGLALGAAWLGLVAAGHGGLAPMFGAFAASAAVIGAQAVGDDPAFLMVKGLILMAGLILCALGHLQASLPAASRSARANSARGAGAVRLGATLALIGLVATTLAYSRSIELPLGLAMALVIAGFVGITVLGSGLAFAFAGLGSGPARAHPEPLARS